MAFGDTDDFSTTMLINVDGMITHQSTYIDTADGDLDAHNGISNKISQFEKTMTSGGNLSEVRKFTPITAKTLITFQTNGSGVMSSHTGNLGEINDDLGSDNRYTTGDTIFNRSGTLESKVSPPFGEDFFSYSVKPIPGEPHTNAISQTRTKVERTQTRFWVVNIENGTVGLMADNIENMTQIQSFADVSEVTGDIKNFQIKYSESDYYSWTSQLIYTW